MNERSTEHATFTVERTFYRDIVPDRRIVHSYTMDRDATRISASVATIEFEPSGTETRLTITEDGVFLDGHDKVEYREHGITVLLNSLAETLRAPAGGRQ